MLLLQTSCWDKAEVEELAIVVAIALDKSEINNVRVTLQVINPKGVASGGGGGMGGGDKKATAYLNISNNGKTIFDAVRAMGSTVPRKLYFSHNQVIIISEELARDGLLDLIDFFNRNPEIRRNNWLLISKSDVNQYHLLDAPNPIELVPAQRITGIIKDEQRSVAYAINQLGDFTELFSTPGTDAYTAAIHLVPDVTKEEKMKVINISHTALFNRDKLVGWLNERESRGLLWISKKISDAAINIPMGEKEKYATISTVRSSFNMKPYITEEGQVIMDIEVKARGSISETDVYIDLSKPENIKKLENKMANQIQKDIILAVEKAQKVNSDVFKFGAAVHRQYPEFWQKIGGNWDQIYPTVEVSVQVDAKISRTGLISKPLRVK